MRAVVIGGAGFLGSHLIDLLLKRNNQVLCIDRESCDTNYMDSINIPVLKGDITDRESIEKHLKEGDVVFHVAALLGAARASREAYWKVNVDGAENVLQAAINKKAKAFVFPSSLAAMGPVGSPEKPMTEETHPKPDSLYGESKLEAEKRIRELGEGKITCIIFRPPPIFGSRFFPKSAAALLFKNMQKPTFFIIGDTMNTFPICYVKNLVGAMVDFAEKKSSGVHAYLIADGPPVVFNDLLMMIRNEFGVNKRIIHVPYWFAYALAWKFEIISKIFGKTPMLSRDVVNGMAKSVYQYDISKAVSHGYKPIVTLAQGVHETADWFKKQQ